MKKDFISSTLKNLCRPENIILICAFFFSHQSFAQKQSRIDSLQTIFQSETNDSLKVIHEITLSKEIHRHKHNIDLEYKHAQSAADRALKIKDTLLYARALDNLGLLYRYHEHYDEALTLHAKAFELIRERDVKPLYKMIFANNAGVAGRYNHNYDKAFNFYLQALQIAETENDLKNIAISSNGIGNTLSNIPGRENEIMFYFERALEAEKARNNSLGMAMNYLSISGYYMDIGDYQTARKYLDDLLAINTERNDLFGLAITYEFRGISYLKEEIDLDKAVSYFKKSVDQFKALNNEHKEAALLVHLGDTYLKKGELNRAENFYQQSLNLSKKLGSFGLISSNASKLSSLSEKKGDARSALEYYKLSHVYRDSINLNEQAVQIEALKRKYDLESKENHIQLLEKDKDLQQAVLNSQKEQLQRKQIVNILLGIGLLAILIIFVLQFRNYRTRKITSAKINLAEKEKMQTIYERNLAQAEILVTRLRVNPHFLFNSLNAINYLIQSGQNDKAVQYLEIFSHYTRMVLDTSNQQLIPLEDELELSEHYLLLEENRFENNFSFSIVSEDVEDIDSILIPPLLLQPFLENAIWHGLLTSPREEKILEVRVVHKEDLTQVIIEDNGAGRNNKPKRTSIKTHKSMGVQIINERIDLYNKTHSGQISYDIVDKKDENGNSLGTQIILNLKDTADHFPFYKGSPMADNLKAI
ncbi:tetratricopeptide repeat protein [Aequorivita sp. H23M31]|uniref:Tetratricopeptide repeat protein n=1 Tax=Aequorivita ciconiae TaxID=2494375 RepID=A0A410G041_9FLAO|nr:tetratricopeptide repeat protein [Aequorivita sp. H23M31]QAA80637.1 tetratricopeptide repeat protein [Aequorivita sp. H23M31]